MRIVTTIVLAYCLITSDATFRLFKSKIPPREQIRPIGGYRLAPVGISASLSVPVVGKYVATYEVSPPLPPPPPLFAPQTYSVPVYPAVAYSAPSVLAYSEPYIEPEERYPACDENGGSFGWK